MPTTHGTPNASTPGKRDSGIKRGALAGPSPAQTNRAPHSPICSGWAVDTLGDAGGELLSCQALCFTQATLGWQGGLSAILRDGGKGS